MKWRNRPRKQLCCRWLRLRWCSLAKPVLAFHSWWISRLKTDEIIVWVCCNAIWRPPKLQNIAYQLNVRLVISSCLSTVSPLISSDPSPLKLSSHCWISGGFLEPASDLCCPPPPPNGPSEHPGAAGREALAWGTLHSHPFLSQSYSFTVTVCVRRSIYVHGYINKDKSWDKASQFMSMDI